MNTFKCNYGKSSHLLKVFLSDNSRCFETLQMNDMDEELKDHEEEFFAIKVTGVDDGHGHLAVSPAGTGGDFEHFGEDHHSDIVFEDIDVI